ncbi:metal dependent phosphohydrolases with conserved 'HD [Thozetella sp. PMI_491]|nr:metal dependent phosphohydrolases with conserved 'HD [Thozetella sp. PMI_491]
MSPNDAANGLNPYGVPAANPDPAVVPNPNHGMTGDWSLDRVLDTVKEGAPTEGTTSPLPYFHALERLKTMKREGWRRFGIERGESIADHMYRMSMITMLAPPTISARLDINRCIKMCLIHDMAESFVGDITPVDGVPKVEKNRREAATMDYLAKRLLGSVYGGVQGDEIRAIWQEYEDSKTDESIFVHDIDKIELLLQMVEYEKRGGGKLDLGEFTYVSTVVVLPETKAWADDIIKEREAFWGAQAHVHGENGVQGGVSTDTREMQDDYYKK